VIDLLFRQADFVEDFFIVLAEQISLQLRMALPLREAHRVTRDCKPAR
jgi:hypothetical protein